MTARLVPAIFLRDVLVFMCQVRLESVQTPSALFSPAVIQYEVR
jgi:hypothetical protein